MNKSTIRIITIVVLIAGALIVALAWFKAEEKVKPRVVRENNIYDADIPPFEQVALDPRLFVLTPEVLAKAPDADVFTAPMGSEWGAFTYDAQTFGAPNEKRGGMHRGQDWNGIGGSDTDLGDAVYAVGRGKVVYTGEPSHNWGKVVVLLHRLPDGSFLQSLYAHLDKISISYGDLVARGQVIGTVGTANGNYPAHLHFEMIRSIGNEAGMRAYGKDAANRVDPETIFRQYPPSDRTLIPDPLPALQEIQAREDINNMNFSITPSAPQSPKQ